MSLSTPLRNDRHFREQFKAALRAHLQADQARKSLALARISDIHPALRPSRFPHPLVYTNDECLVMLCGLAHREREHVDQNYDPVNFTLPSAEYLESVFKPFQKHEIMKDFKPPKYEPPPPAVGHDLSVPWGTPEPTQFEPSNSKPPGNEPPSPTVYYARSDSPYEPDLPTIYHYQSDSSPQVQEASDISKQPEYNPRSPSFSIYAGLDDDWKVQCLGNIKPGESGYGDAKFLPDFPADERNGTWLAGTRKDGSEDDGFRQAITLWALGKRRDQQAERHRRKEAQRRKKMEVFQIKELLRMSKGWTESQIPVHLWEEFDTREVSNDPEEDPETASERASSDDEISDSEQWKELKPKIKGLKKKLMRNICTAQRITTPKLTVSQFLRKALPPLPPAAIALPAAKKPVS
jgi:hypothetical protein